MKNKFLYATLATMALASSCSNDELIQDVTSLNRHGDNRISFVQKVGNMTKAAQENQAQNKNHYEFGVFAAHDGIYNPGAPTSAVMNNYLVAFKDEHHYTVAGGGDTYLAPTGTNEALTVPENGYSSWFYQDLTATNSKAELTQILKYWDFSTGNTDFIAYMPYEKQAGDEPEAGQVAYAIESSNAKLTYYGLSSFYTAPTVQVTTAKLGTTTTAHPITSGADNDENIVNANEALYAHTNVPKANYGQDVPLEFKHVNAKVKVAIYEVIPGYKVHILDLVPTDLSSQGGPSATSPGVQFTPATHEDATAYSQPTKASTLQGKYYASANLQVSGVNDPATAEVSIPDQTTALVNTNTCFAAPVGSNSTIANYTSTPVIAEATPGTESATVHYVLPNHNGTDYIIGNSDARSAVAATGYTFHVSYEIIPEDGLASTKVYDARVWVAPDYCRWQAGKAYTYIFKITKNSNGTTDPGKIDPADPSTPWIDPDDPRIPDDPALIPIVFDGVIVSDYEDAGDVEGNDHLITDITSDPNWGVKVGDNTISYGQYTKSQVPGIIGSVYDIIDVETALTGGNWSYDAVNKKHKYTSSTVVVASFNIVESSAVTTVGTAGTTTWKYQDVDDSSTEKTTTNESDIADDDIIVSASTQYDDAVMTHYAKAYVWSTSTTAKTIEATATQTGYTSVVTPTSASTTKADWNTADKNAPEVTWNTMTDWGTPTVSTAADHGAAAYLIVKTK